MTVISVAVTDTGRNNVTWEVPPDPRLIDSPIPRGLRNYGGTTAIAALGTNDETQVTITLEFPTAFNWLCKSATIEFSSDDLTSEFSNLGVIEYRPAGASDFGVMKRYEIFSNGQSFPGGARSSQIYAPTGTWRQWIDGPNQDTVTLRISDVSNDTSTAGDVRWTADFWMYDIAQCLKWPVNTAVPNLTY